jgi:hypothetical protein
MVVTHVSPIAKSPSVSRDLVAVSTECHAAPAAMVGFGLVTEPEHARLVLAQLHQVKVGAGQQLSGSFSHGSENQLDGGLRTDFLDFERARLVPNKPEMTLRTRQKTVENRGVPSLPSLSFFQKRANILTQRSRRI